MMSGSGGVSDRMREKIRPEGVVKAIFSMCLRM